MLDKRLLTIPLILIVVLAGSVSAAEEQDHPAQLFSGGNTAYQQGNFKEAENIYRSILDLGFENGPLYYNLGNACFKQKKIGEAIYFWEKAKRLSPADTDITGNLELARLLLVDRIETPEDPYPVRTLKSIRNLLTIAQETRLVVGLFLAANLLFLLFILLKKPRSAYRALIGACILGAITLISAVSLAWKIYDRDFIKNGIVLQQRVDVLSGPGSDNVTVFTVHEGIKVRIHQSINGWDQVSLPNGWNGWLPQDAVGVL